MTCSNTRSAAFAPFLNQQRAAHLCKLGREFFIRFFAAEPTAIIFNFIHALHSDRNCVNAVVQVKNIIQCRLTFGNKMSAAERFHCNDALSLCMCGANFCEHFIGRAVCNAKTAFVYKRKQNLKLRMPQCAVHTRNIMCGQSDSANVALVAHFNIVFQCFSVPAYCMYTLLFVHQKNIDIIPADSLKCLSEACLRARSVVGIAF